MAPERPVEEAVHARAFPRFEFKGSRTFYGALLVASGTVAAGLAAIGVGALSFLAVLYAVWAAFRVIWPGRLLVTEEGIVDELFWYSPGLIPWSDVTDVRPARWWLVEIDLVDEGAFMERLGPFSQLARVKQRLYGFGPAVIVPWVLQGGRQSVVGRLEDGLDAYTRLALSDPGGPSG